jgi:hypothetical protein
MKLTTLSLLLASTNAFSQVNCGICTEPEAPKDSKPPSIAVLSGNTPISPANEAEKYRVLIGVSFEMKNEGHTGRANLIEGTSFADAFGTCRADDDLTGC